MLTIETILVASIIGIGTVVGLATFRNAVTQELGDAAAGLASINHGYRYVDTLGAAVIDNMAFSFTTAGSTYDDLPNFCEPAELDPLAGAPMGIEFLDVEPNETDLIIQ